jgi:hypothetical protein
LEILRGQNEQLKQNNAFLQQTVDRLIGEVVRMKSKGFEWVPGPTDVVEEKVSLAPVVEAAIAQRFAPGAGGDVAVWAQKMIDGGADPESVADQILKGAEGMMG